MKANESRHYADWPTFPQLYIKGELAGSADTVRDMYQQGELQKLLDSATD
jgi:monothiol glutaredoxin